MTRHVLAAADAVLVVGRADPVGLSRLVRALHDLADLVEVEPVAGGQPDAAVAGMVGA